MTIRPATADDLPAIAAVMAAAGEPVDWPGLPGWPYLEALLARSGARVLVATGGDADGGGDDGGIVAMGASIPLRTGLRFVTDLFVHPDRQSAGVGRSLLDAVLAGSPDRATFSSADPRALAAYIRAGMRPWWPLLYLEVPRTACLPFDDSLGATPADVATTAQLAAAWSGLDHASDFAACAIQPDAVGWVITDVASSEPAAVAWTRRGRTRAGRCVEHTTIAPGADPIAATQRVLAAGIADAQRLLITIPGPHPAVRALLEGGARILDRDTFCASEPGLVEVDRLLPSPGFL